MHPILSEVQARQWMADREREAAEWRARPRRARAPRWTIGTPFTRKARDPSPGVGRLRAS